VSIDGLPPFQPVRIGFGSLSQYEVIGRADADGAGNLELSLRVPGWGELDRVHFFVASFGNQMPRGFSEPFHVTDADGTARIYGTISAEGMSCLTLEGPQETLYTLEGDTGIWTPGQRVMVVGSVAAQPSCGTRGLPIVVREIRPSL
jgi:hypothetical protein